MAETVHRLPDDFLVGASTSAHQTEGNNVASDWWAMEHAPDSRQAERSGDACDSYHRWREDMDLLASLGLDAYRFSIEWARIEPEPGAVSHAELQHYVRMVAGARDRGLEPVLTLHHFTHPRWFAARGGWPADGAMAAWERYLELVAPVLDAGVRTAITINEPNILAIQARAAAGDEPLGDGLPEPDPAVRDAVIEAHHRAVALLHVTHPGLAVGWSVANQVPQALPGGEEQAALFAETREDVFLRASRGDDVVGVQTYTRTLVGPDGVVPVPADAERTATGWEYYPPSLEHALRHTSDVVGDVPILVTENGIATDDDARRLAYTRGALAGLVRAMTDGVDVRGYLHWSALDNYEWGSYAPRFGLIAVDRATFQRTPKPSAHWLGELARSREVPLDG